GLLRRVEGAVDASRLDPLQRLPPGLGEAARGPEQPQPVARVLAGAAQQLAHVDAGGLARLSDVEPYPGLPAREEAGEETQVHVDDGVAVLGEIDRLHGRVRAGTAREPSEHTAHQARERHLELALVLPERPPARHRDL